MNIKRFFTSTKFQAILIFVIAFSFFLFFQFQIPDFLGRDAYYHLKIAKLMSEGKFIFHQFPWLYFTTLHQNFSDQHFLFHLFLTPFLFLGNFISLLCERMIGGDFLGAKIAAAFFSSLAVLIFYFILRQNKVFGAFFWTVLLFGASSGFIFRMNLMQAQGLAMIWLFLGFLALTSRKYVWFLPSSAWLLPISFLYSWTHGGFVLILVMVGVWCFIGSLNLLREQPRMNSGILVRPRINSGVPSDETNISSLQTGNCKTCPELAEGLRIDWKLEIENLKLKSRWRSLFMIFKPLWFVLAGLILGILFHPYFSELLPFLKTQLFQTGPFAKISVGAEWYPYQTKNFLLSSGLALLCFILAIAVLVINRISEKKFVLNKEHFVSTFALFFLSLLFFILTLSSQRFVEYLTPFSLLFCAFVLAPHLKVFANNLLAKSYLNKLILVKFFAAIVLLSAVLFAWGGSILITKRSFVASYSQEYQEAAQWLRNNTSNASIVANLDWSDFPPLFYYNDKNFYVAGLDPTFFYQYDKDLYQKYEDIIAGRNFAKAGEILKNDFKTNYLVINNKFGKLEEKIKSDRRFLKVYGNGYLRVYKII